MAVYTNVDDAALDEFLEAYDLGTVLSFAGIAEGVENSNYLLRTDRAHYILTLYEKGWTGRTCRSLSKSWKCWQNPG